MVYAAYVVSYIFCCCLYSSFLLYKSSASLPAPDSISPIESTNLIPVLATSTTGLKPNDLGDALQLTVDENTPASYSRIVATPSSLAAVATGLPFEVHTVLF